jgi:transmembrane sensor
VSLLDPRSRAVVAADVRDRIDLRLIDGPAAFEVREAPGRSFVVRLTRIEVKILAASFVLTPDGDRAQLRVTAGRVQVDWPGGTGTVGPGAPVWFPPSLTEATPARKADAPAGVSSLRSRFRAQAARHDYAAAYRSLVSAPGVAQQSAEDLMLAADAARLSGHPAEAVPYLRHLLDDYPADERAPVAAFTLGRILLSQLARPAEAADAFGLSRRLAPGGTLAPDALAREVEASARAGDRVRARALAAEYVSRYPGGRRAEAVRRFAGVE